MSGLIVPGRAEAEIVRAYPPLRHLLYLRDAAWRFLPLQPGRDQIDGVRVWPDGWRDAIRFRDADDALGLRLDRDTAITWEHTGALADVVQELLALPHPRSRLAPRLAKGRGPELR
ncbi:hypothetical protein [Saccharothrix coeruleofusca]|uniref:Uncharacterized protein n=1 Tax=Saccharothrix coeruleofusca TaxID=33919 RepID=A0A918AK87_9PSEU|nr:hypothetical protein [Saccharothrix coeruleofusca]MBP2336583.1 uncharacterized protein YcbX [Saccharothrix coeruleofusca]GGP51986.1 hypothetical protein GCM10010185_25050 [Saccharothrix coeruleofusca]